MRSGTAAQHERILQLFQRHASDARSAGLTRLGVQASSGDTIVVEGRELTNFGNCSYLGLELDQRVKAGAIQATERFGTFYSSSSAYTYLDLYSDLQQRLSEMFDAHIVIPTTTTLGHISALPVLVRPGSKVLIDAQGHTSLHLATQILRSEGIEVTPLPHNDVEALEAAVAEASPGHDQVWYLADGVYSMAGDTAPVEAVAEIQERYGNLWTYYDDAHGIGWSGRHGRGVVLSRTSLHPRMVVAASLVKGVGAGGAALAFSSEELADRVQLLAGPMTFSGPLIPAGLGASIASLDILLSDEGDELRGRLSEQIELVARLGRELGMPFAAYDHTPIWFAQIGRHDQMIEVGSRMVRDGFYLNPASFPVVPYGASGLRFTHTLHHDLEQIERMLRTMAGHIEDVVGSRVIDLTDPALAEVSAPKPGEE